ncbi:MAG: trypsin-like peptidase domain-containing protein [Phycisphaeraceae bacterium]|nr:trypsin-like peptidase domain-containing protein [Phycisphaeraceae bacterium]
MSWFLLACTQASNSIEIRQQEAQLIPMGLFEVARSVAAPVYPLHTEIGEEKASLYAENGATGTLLPNGQMLTAAHVFHKPIALAEEGKLGVVYPFLIQDKTLFAAAIHFEPPRTSNGDWVLFSLMQSSPTVLPPTPDSIFMQRARFDGRKPIAKGTPLYCVGFPRTPGDYPGLTGFSRELTIVQGCAVGDFGPDEEVEAISTTEIDMRGMSGGPVGTYNFFTGEFTVVGTLTRGSGGVRFFGERFGVPHFTASRIAPVVMKRLEASSDPDGAPSTH